MIIGVNVCDDSGRMVAGRDYSPGRSKTAVLPFWFACVAGIAPWGVIVINPFGSTDRTTKEVPTFVVGIVISPVIYITSFALNQGMQYHMYWPPVEVRLRR